MTIHPYYNKYGLNIFAPPTSVLLPAYTIAIPPTQIIYPFTPAPNITSNAVASTGFWTGLNVSETTDFFVIYCKTGSIGDWGKPTGAFYWPDLNTPGLNTPWDRRLGANFNLGAMAASAGLNIDEALLGGEVGPVVKQHQLHSPAEQEAIEAGFRWWTDAPRTAITNGATLLVHLKTKDQ